MGRHYSGDIEGKFAFGIQSSNDADFFGVIGQEVDLYYYYDEEDLDKVKKNLTTCKKNLRGYLTRLKKYFATQPTYNDELIMEYLGLEKTTSNKEKTAYLLEWYFRLELGEKIYQCIKKNGQCEFTAEL